MKTLKTLPALSLIALVAALGSGCANIRNESQSTQTAVSLNQSNYRVVKDGAIGTSCGFKLLGILPIASASASKARAHLYRDLKMDLQGKSTALADLTQDRTTFYLILFSVPKVTVQADVIEYMGATGSYGSSMPTPMSMAMHP
jgi:hypothetical protein